MSSFLSQKVPFGAEHFKQDCCTVRKTVLLERYICRQGIDGVKPAWRRAKALDNFHHRVGQIHEALILDDPEVDKLNMSDIKSWMTSEEDATYSGRYNDVRMVRNNIRAIASNDLQEQHEPPKDNGRRYITSEEFFTLVSKFFAGLKRADVLAVLKRSGVMVFGQHALYLRLPHQDPDAIVHRIHTDDVHLDLFSPRDKPQYAKYKVGIEELPPTFAEDVALEQRTLQDSMASMVQFKSPDQYIEQANKRIGDKISGFLRLPTSFWDQHVSSDSDAGPPPTIHGTPLTTATASGAPKRLGTFVYPTPARRVKTKSSPAASASTAPVNIDEQDTLVQVAEDDLGQGPAADLTSRGQDTVAEEGEADPDEEAANYLNA